MICCSLLDWFSIPNHVASNHGSDSPRVFTSVIGWKNLFLSNRVYPAPIIEYPAPTFELSTDSANLPWVLTAFPNIDLYIVGFSPTLIVGCQWEPMQDYSTPSPEFGGKFCLHSGPSMARGQCFKVVRGSSPTLGRCTNDMICCSLLDWFSIPNHVAIFIEIIIGRIHMQRYIYTVS